MVALRAAMLASVLALAFSALIRPAWAQPNCRDTPEGRTCTVQQPIVAGTLVPLTLQRDLGLITVGGRCSGTLVNQYWVLTADHCLTTNGAVNGPSAMFAQVPITAAWSDRVVTPTRFVRNWGTSGLDIALVFLGGGNFGRVNLQLLFAGDVDPEMTLTKYGRGIFRYAVAGMPPTTPPTPAAQDGQYRSARFTPSAASATAYTLPVNPTDQVGNGGDSGGPDVVTAPNGIGVGIAGVQSSCTWTGQVPGAPPGGSVWTWVTAISSCTSAALNTIRHDVVPIIQEGRIPCPGVSAACAVLETTSLLQMLH